MLQVGSYTEEYVGTPLHVRCKVSSHLKDLVSLTYTDQTHSSRLNRVMRKWTSPTHKDTEGRGGL